MHRPLSVILSLSCALAVGCDDASPGADAGADAGAGSDAGSLDAGSGPDSGASDAGMLDCFDFSDDPDVPLAIDGVFGATSPTWRRPHDDTPVCPATALLPTTAAEVPFVVYAFCNRDGVEHTYDVEWLGQGGAGGEPPLDDPYLVVYDGVGIPADALSCRAVNDDIPDALDAKDSIVTGITVPAGGSLTVVGTTYTFDPTDGTGQGGYVMVVTNAD